MILRLATAATLHTNNDDFKIEIKSNSTPNSNAQHL